MPILVLASAIVLSQLGDAARPIYVEINCPLLKASETDESIARPLEKHFASFGEVERARSLSLPHVCRWRFDLKPRADRKAFREKLRLTLIPAMNALPKELKLDVSILPEVSDEFFVLYVRDDGTRNSMDRSALTHRVREKVSTIPHVAQCFAVGDSQAQIRIFVDLEKVHARDLSLTELFACCDKFPKMASKDTMGLLRFEDDLGALLVKTIAGQPVNLRDVARIELGAIQNGSSGEIRRDRIGQYQAASVPLIVVVPQPGEETSVKTGLDSLVKNLGREMPSGTQLDWRQFEPGAKAILMIPRAGDSGASNDNFKTDQLMTAAVKQVAEKYTLESVIWHRRADHRGYRLLLRPAEVNRIVASDRQDSPEGFRMKVQPASTGPFWPSDTFEIRLRGDDHLLLMSAAASLMNQVKSVRGAIDPSILNEMHQHRSIDIDRKKAETMKIPREEIDAAVRLASRSSQEKSDSSHHDTNVSIMMEAPAGEMLFEGLKLRTRDGLRVPFSTVASKRDELLPRWIMREQGRETATIGFDVRGRDLPSVRADVEKVIHDFDAKGMTITLEK